MPLTEQQIRAKIDQHIGNELNPKIRGAIHNEILNDIMDFLGSVAGNYAKKDLIFDGDRSHNAASYRDLMTNLRQYLRSVSFDPGAGKASFSEKGFGNTSGKIIKEWLNGDNEQVLLLNAIGELFFTKLAAKGISPSAYLHLPASDGSAGSGPMKINPGTLLFTPENGLIEADSNHFYKTQNGKRDRLATFEQTVSLQTASTSTYTIDFSAHRVIRLTISVDTILSFAGAKKGVYSLVIDNTQDYAVSFESNSLWKSNLGVQPNVTKETKLFLMFDGTFMYIHSSFENMKEI